MNKKIMVLIISASILMIVGCNKNEMMKKDLGIDLKKYEAALNIDYSEALLNHNTLNSTGVTNNDHAAHHALTAYTLSSDPNYFKLMYNRNDSLFSEHFYEFCFDMMKNSGMMVSTNNMMGNNSGMMVGGKDMMNGSTMGGSVDMNKMMSYIDSLHSSDKTMMNPDYMKTDSLMFNQMNMCKMMDSETNSIVSIYSNMQVLRKNHKTLHGI